MTAAKESDATMDASLPQADARARDGAAMGQRFAGRYTVVEELGRGGMGVVYAAEDALLGGERVALKVLFEGHSSSVERFRREVLLARRISSPHVARTHDLGETGGRFFLTMELVEGESLARRLHALATTGSRLPVSEAVRIVRAIALGLAAAHDAGVVHRDLKPDNVLLGPGGRVVVTDFGIARALSGPEAARATAGIVGTPAYMSPEQLEGRTTDARTDLYALGVVLFECLTSELPFVAETPLAAALLRLHQPPRELPAELAVPPELRALLAALLSRRADDRPADARAIVAALDPLLEGVVRTPTFAPTPAPTPVPGQRHTSRREHGIVVMPFEHRGAEADQYVTQQIQGELADVLSRTAGLRVVGDLGADMRTLEARALARFGVHAAVQVAQGGARLRASLRLIELATGVQVAAETVELTWADTFAAPELMAAKLAEALRLWIEVASAEGKVSPEALDAYRQARRGVRGSLVQSPDAIFAHLERAIQLAPGFAPPLALAALAAARFSFAVRESGQDYRALARTALERALRDAGHLPETRFAASAVAWHDLKLREAVQEARAALALAPVSPEAIAFLGQLELEAGRPEQGLLRLERARALEPTLRVTVFEPARWHLLYGDLGRFRELEKEMKELREDLLLAQYYVRGGAWRGDHEMIRAGIRLYERQESPMSAPLIRYGKVALGEEPVAEGLPDWMVVASPRLATIAYQMLAETTALAGQDELALARIEKAASIALTDLEWIDKCPFFTAIRDTPRYRAVRQVVLERCAEIWVAA